MMVVFILGSDEDTCDSDEMDILVGQRLPLRRSGIAFEIEIHEEDGLEEGIHRSSGLQSLDNLQNPVHHLCPDGGSHLGLGEQVCEPGLPSNEGKTVVLAVEGLELVFPIFKLGGLEIELLYHLLLHGESAWEVQGVSDLRTSVLVLIYVDFFLNYCWGGSLCAICFYVVHEIVLTVFLLLCSVFGVEDLGVDLSLPLVEGK